MQRQVWGTRYAVADVLAAGLHVWRLAQTRTPPVTDERCCLALGQTEMQRDLHANGS